MSGYTIEWEPPLDDIIESLDGFDKTANKHLRKGMLQSVILIESKVRPLTPVGVSSRLRNSIFHSVKNDLGANVIGTVGSNLKEEYPAVMEFGRKPGKMPPPSALERWVKIVMRVPAKDVKGVAFVVARAIGKKGIKGRFYMKKGWDQSKAQVNRYFAQALDKIVEDLARGRH